MPRVSLDNLRAPLLTVGRRGVYWVCSLCSTKQLKIKPLFWTKDGLTALGQTIRSARERRGLTLVEAANLIKEVTGRAVGFRTLASVETAIGEPKFNTLAAIAAAGFVEVGGRRLNISDFIKIASECFEAIDMNALAQLINDHLQQTGQTLQEFAQQTGVELADLEGIMRGDYPNKPAYDQETDLILIAGHLTNPSTGRKFHSYTELVEYCGMSQNAVGIWLQSHTSDGTNCLRQ